MPQRPRRHHFHDVPPWPHQYHYDYVYVDRGGWWPRWYPYWDPTWFAYWWYLYDYYGGDASADYAEYARDAFLRQNAAQWGFSISGMPQIGSETSLAQRAADNVAKLRKNAFEVARMGYLSPKGGVFPYIGFRVTPLGGEVVLFGTSEGMQRWASDQAQDSGVYYAAAFDLNRSIMAPIAEVVR